MDSKDLHKQFRAAAWPTRPALDAFLEAAGKVMPGELAKLLGDLTDRTLGSDVAAHRNRCTAFRRLVEQAPDPGLFVPFARALKTADSSTRAVLVDLLPKVNSVHGHAELASALRQPEQAVRRAAYAVLAKIAGKSVFDLASQLACEEIPGRLEAIELTASIGGYHAVPVLDFVATNASRPEHRVLALKLLGDARLMARDLPGAAAAVQKALGDPAEAICTQAVLSFANVCTKEQFDAQLEPYWDAESPALVRAVVDGARRFPTPRTMRALERRFRMGPNALRIAVLNTLEAIGSDATLPILTEALNIKQLPVRNRAAEALSNLALAKKISLARTLMWLLRSRDVDVRRIAVDLAKKVGDPTGELWPSLLRFLRDEDWWVRERVVDALVDMAGTQLTRHVVAYLQDPSDVVRRYAVDVLMRLKDPQSLGALVRTATGDTDWWVCERAIETIGLLRDLRATPYLVDLMQKRDEFRLACLSALAEMQARQAAGAVAALLTVENVDVRIGALRCLGEIGSAELAPAVQQVLGDIDHRARAAAKELLVKWNLSVTSGHITVTAGLSPLDRLLVHMAREEADDLLIAPGRPPYLKKLGKVTPLSQPPMSADDVAALLLPHLSDSQQQELEGRRDVDFSYEVKTEDLRFRANIFQEQNGLSAVFRIVKGTVLSFEQLGLPEVVRGFSKFKNGLVIVGGPTGAGKSTTLATLIDSINQDTDLHIITLEDPIEAVHQRKKSLINQREIGTHTRSFETALRSVLREDPDVILVGEMRDLATISFAVTAAETGHLVFGTLHTVSADTTMDRLINAFPGGQQGQVRSMLADSLRAVLCQHLLRRVDRPGRVLAVEVMVNNEAIGNLVRKGKTYQIPSLITTGKDLGMQSMDWDLKRLLKEGVVGRDEAYMKANNKKDVEEFIEQLSKEQALAAKSAAAVPPSMPARAPVAPRAAGK